MHHNTNININSKHVFIESESILPYTLYRNIGFVMRTLKTLYFASKSIARNNRVKVCCVVLVAISIAFTGFHPYNIILV